MTAVLSRTAAAPRTDRRPLRIPVLVCGLVVFCGTALRAPAQPVQPAAEAQSAQSAQSPQQPGTAPDTPPGADYPPAPTIVTTFRQVVLDVTVTDAKGHAVIGLQPSDFRLTENGVPQTLAHFTPHSSLSAQAPPPEPPKLPPNSFMNHAPLTGTGPIMVILFDELSFADGAYARYEVAQFMKTLKPGMPICIFRLDSYGLHLIQDFTTDPQTLREAVNSKRNQQPMQIPIYARPWYTQDALRQLAMYLSGFSGRKNLIWFTDGRSTALQYGVDLGYFPDQTSLEEESQGTADILTLSRVVLYPIDARGLVVGSTRGFYVLAEDGYLADLAAATGGHAFYSTNGFKEAVAQVISVGSNYDTLAYNPTDTRWDGHYRKIKVTLGPSATAHATSPDGQRLTPPFHLAYRTGYYATPSPLPRGGYQAATTARRMISYSPRGDPAGPGSAIASPFDRAMGMGAIAPFQILFRADVHPDPTLQSIKRHATAPAGVFLAKDWLHRPYRLYTIHYIIDSQDIRFTPVAGQRYRDTLEIAAAVYGDDGLIASSLLTTVPIDLSLAEYKRVLGHPLGIDQKVAVPAKGNFLLRLGIHDQSSDRIGALEVPVESIQLPTGKKADKKPGPTGNPATP